jgi:hypothetical protein
MSLIEVSISTRWMVREILELAENDAEDKDLFWRIVQDESSKHVPHRPVPEMTNIRPLSDLEGKRFGRQLITFGTWKDCSYEHVYLQDADYLDWLADRGMELLRWLKWRKAKR